MATKREAELQAALISKLLAQEPLTTEEEALYQVMLATPVKAVSKRKGLGRVWYQPNTATSMEVIVGKRDWWTQSFVLVDNEHNSKWCETHKKNKFVTLHAFGLRDVDRPCGLTDSTTQSNTRYQGWLRKRKAGMVRITQLVKENNFAAGQKLDDEIKAGERGKTKPDGLWFETADALIEYCVKEFKATKAGFTVS